MTTLSNREKNTAHDQRQRIRPAPQTYNFAELDAVVRAWVAPRAEDLSPFATCNS